jgi:hypothetical protein
MTTANNMTGNWLRTNLNASREEAASLEEATIGFGAESQKILLYSATRARSRLNSRATPDR